MNICDLVNETAALRDIKIIDFHSISETGSVDEVVFNELMGGHWDRNKSQIADGGDGRPPRGDNFGLPIDNYEKERADIKLYFAANAVKSVLKTPEDELYAAIGVRFLNSMGKKLDNYEIGLPQDYRLQILKRIGTQVELFQGRHITWYQPPETMEGGFVFRTDFGEIVRKPIPHRSGIKSYGEVFQKGFNRENTDYAPLWKFVFMRDAQDFPYIGSSKNKGLSVEEFTRISRENFLYIINPRALNTIDLEKSPEAQYDRFVEAISRGEVSHDFKPPMFEPENALKRQKEITFVGNIDPRDIKGCFRISIIETGGLKKPQIVSEFIENPNYLRSHWELPGPYRM